MDTAMDADAAVGEETPAQMDDAHVAPPAAEATMDAENPSMATTAAAKPSMAEMRKNFSSKLAAPGATARVQSAQGYQLTRVNVRDVSGGVYGNRRREWRVARSLRGLRAPSRVAARVWNFQTSRCIKVHVLPPSVTSRRSSRRSPRLSSRRPSILVPPYASSIFSNDRVTIGFERRPRTVRVVSSRTGRARRRARWLSPPPFRRTRRMSSGRARPARSSNPSVSIPRASRRSSSTRTPSPPAWSPSRNREPIASRRRDTRGVRPSGRVRNRAIGSKTESGARTQTASRWLRIRCSAWRVFRRDSPRSTPRWYRSRRDRGSRVSSLRPCTRSSSIRLRVRFRDTAICGVRRRPELRRGNEATRWPFPPPLVNTPSRDAGRRVRMRATAPSRAFTGSRVAPVHRRKRSICFPWTGSPNAPRPRNSGRSAGSDRSTRVVSPMSTNTGTRPRW